MKVSELHEKLFNKLILLLPDWRFVKKNREFKRMHERVVWYFHVSCINHPADFDATADVAVEFVTPKSRVIIGAGLGNIDRVGQVRFPVESVEDAESTAQKLRDQLESVGLPFLRRFSQAGEVLRVLRQGGPEADLIGPVRTSRDSDIAGLEEFIATARDH